jgi:hypothetical protein
MKLTEECVESTYYPGWQGPSGHFGQHIKKLVGSKIYIHAYGQLHDRVCEQTRENFSSPVYDQLWAKVHGWNTTLV